MHTNENPREQFAEALIASWPSPLAEEPMSAKNRVILDIMNERLRQDELIRRGVLPFNCADRYVVNAFKLPVLIEEVGEVGKALYEWNIAPSSALLSKRAHLRTELIQVAAVAAAWAESLTEELAEHRTSNAELPTSNGK
jgi:NTP pyrophosphatase (non-canonical NTP hydrolase)